jgi:hypothetical protein
MEYISEARTEPEITDILMSVWKGYFLEYLLSSLNNCVSRENGKVLLVLEKKMCYLREKIKIKKQDVFNKSKFCLLENWLRAMEHKKPIALFMYLLIVWGFS